MFELRVLIGITKCQATMQECVGTVWTCVHKALELSMWLRMFGTVRVGMTELVSFEDPAAMKMRPQHSGVWFDSRSVYVRCLVNVEVP